MAARSHLGRQEWTVRQSSFFDDNDNDNDSDSDSDNAPRRYRLIRKAVSGSNDGKHGAVCEGDGAVADNGSDCG